MMNVFICDNPACENYGNEIQMKHVHVGEVHSEFWGRVRWDSITEVITPCCQTQLFSEFTPSQFEERIGFEVE